MRLEIWIAIEFWSLCANVHLRLFMPARCAQQCSFLVDLCFFMMVVNCEGVRGSYWGSVGAERLSQYFLSRL